MEGSLSKGGDIVRYLLETQEWSSDPRNVMDEYTIECKEEIAEDVKKISEDCIRDAGILLGIKCPHAGEGAIGKNWYDIH